jgi:hypothetical protein
MNQTAQGLAALGRGPDTQLVHMAPGEVKSLQQLAMAHGGSLTINPDTGLPEAGFLSSILPMLVGAGLSIASGGALTPMMAAMMTGGGTALATGSLKKGLAAGFGAYGGAGLGGALAGAGAGTAGAASAMPELVGNAGVEAAAQPAAGMFDNAAANFKNAGSGLTGLTSKEGLNAFMGNAASKGVAATGIGGAKGLAMAGLAAASPMMMETTTKQPEIKTDSSVGQQYSYAPNPVGPTPTPDVPGYGNQGQNFGKEKIYFNPRYTKIPEPTTQNVATNMQGSGIDPYTGQMAFADGGEIGGYTYDPATQKYSGGTPIANQLSGVGVPQQYANGSIGGFSFDPVARRYTQLESNPEYLAYQKAAAALPIDYGGGSDGGYGGGPGPGEGDSVGGGGMSNSGEGGGAPGEGGWAHGGLMALARGGISSLGDYSDGGRLLRGPGDGVSDSIPAMIGKKQQARLADGEFVVPARIVSELGNGSTEAGARKLYAMMDRVQKARGKTVGKGKIATNSRAAKHLPA